MQVSRGVAEDMGMDCNYKVRGLRRWSCKNKCHCRTLRKVAAVRGVANRSQQPLFSKKDLIPRIKGLRHGWSGRHTCGQLVHLLAAGIQKFAGNGKWSSVMQDYMHLSLIPAATEVPGELQAADLRLARRSYYRLIPWTI